MTEADAKAFAKDIGAIFQTTSAKLSNGVEELFKMIGKKFVNPDAENYSNLTKDELEKKKNQIKIQEIKSKKEIMEDVVVVIAEINKHFYFRYKSSFY